MMNDSINNNLWALPLILTTISAPIAAGEAPVLAPTHHQQCIAPLQHNHYTLNDWIHALEKYPHTDCNQRLFQITVSPCTHTIDAVCIAATLNTDPYH